MNLSNELKSLINEHQWIPWSVATERLNFQKRICTTFIANETNTESCVCNYKHSKSESSDLHGTWNRQEHTQTESTKCYGILPQSNNPYVRCDIETELEKLCFMLFDIWNIAVPGLIMRMIGDIDFAPNIKIEKELLQGISDAAVASDAWIITSGYKEESLSELIGEIVYNNRIKNPDINFSTIAVGKWGNIHDCHKLYERKLNNQSTIYEGHGRYKLESNHTHYIFFDDGTCDSLDTGEFASNLARKISLGARRRIPLITVLVGATLHALLSIYANLRKHIPIVIVNESGPLADLLCKYLKLTESLYKPSKSESQKTVDDEVSSDDEDDMDIAMIDEKFLQDNDEEGDKEEEVEEEQEQEHDDEEEEKEEKEEEEEDESEPAPTSVTLRSVLRPLGKVRRDFVNDVRKLYNIIRQQEYEAQGKRLPVGEILNLNEEKTFAQYLYQFASCLKSPFRDYIHVFNMNSSKSLKETIYYAFVQAKDNLSQTQKKQDDNIHEKVHMALRWGIGDIKEDYSVAAAKIWNDTNKITQNQSILIDALSKNLLLFVMNFVKLDVDFAVLFGPIPNSPRNATSLWSPKHHYLKELYSDAKRKNRDPLYLLDQISSENDFSKEKDLATVLKILVGDIMHPIYEDQSMVQSTSLLETDAEYIYRDLFLWCILTYRLDMAKIFLSQMKTRICSALIASKILKSLAAYAPDQAAKDTLYTKAGDFETHAIEFIRCSYFYDKHQACELIMRRLDLYGDVTCLEMAIAADDKKFLHEDACQTLLTNIWYDKVDPVREQNRLIINILTLGISQILISMYQKRFLKDSKMKQEKHTMTHPRRRLNKNGIDYTDDYDIDQTVLQHFIHFHNRPIVKYFYSCFGYILFLFFFSYYMLRAFDPPSNKIPSIHWTEIITIITVTTMLFEELRQFLSQDDRSLMGKLRAYFDLSNRVSNVFLVLPAYLLFYIGLVLRFTLKDPNSFAYARIIMALDLELWFIRSIFFIGIAPSLGPKLVMIRKMTNDLLLFIIIFIIFIFAYGITSRSMIAYSTIDFTGRQFFRDVVYPVYYFVLGSFDNEREKLDATPNTGAAMATHLVFAFHMLFVNILLINLLIALFSFTINDVQTQARYVWAYDRYNIIRSYHVRPALFPPFTFLISILQYCQWWWKRLYRKCRSKEEPYDEQSNCFKMIPINDAVDHAWSEFERYSTNDYMRQLLDDQAAVLAKGMTTDIISESATTNADESKRIKSLINDLQEGLEDTLTQTDDKLESMESSITDLQSRFTEIENSFDRYSKEMKEIKKALNWMMTAMVNAKMSELPPPLMQETSRANSLSQKQQTEPKSFRSNQQSARKYTTSKQGRLYQGRLSTSEHRTEMTHPPNDDDSA